MVVWCGMVWCGGVVMLFGKVWYGGVVSCDLTLKNVAKIFYAVCCK